MQLYEMYRGINALANADGTDDYLGIDDFNRLIKEEEIRLMIDVMDEEKNRPLSKRPMTDALLQSRAFTASPTDTVYEFPLPEGYLMMDSIVYIDANGVKHKVEMTSAENFISRLDNLLEPPLEENYICYMEEGDALHPGRYLMFRPVKTGGTWGVFFRGRRTRDPENDGVWVVVDPYLDYYSDANDELKFLAEDEDLNTIGAGSTYRDGTALPQVGTSLTEELYIPSLFHPRLMDRMIERMGLKDRDPLEIQFSAMKNAQDANK